MGEMRVLTQAGDERLEWDPADEKSTAAAKAEFAKRQEEGYLFYEVAEARGKAVTKFDPKAGKLIAAPGARSAADKKAGTRPRAMAGGPVASSAAFR
jgi:hypothetical protein